jgi:crotonobetainyl-CoA:carnitine CoA-transferase CaiB-like acyl-CoA transferase
MHQEAEKLLGRQSSEVGELRKVVDDYITSQPQQTAPQQHVEPEEDIDYFTDPQAAVNRAIENHPKIKEAQAYSTQYRKQTSLATLQSKHPDMQDILKDEKFADWIKASKIRTQLFVEADQQFNSEAADELFSLWKERKTVAQQTAVVEKQARKQQLKAANTGSAQGSAEGTRRKIYRRADIIKLMRTDPERYQAISEEILAAYAEGRVK